MPEPITVAIITTVGGIIIAVVPFWLSRKSKESAETIASEQPKPIASAPDHEAVLTLPERTEQENTKVTRTEAELSKIANSITATPPFSQEHVKEQYRGRSVTWAVELYTVEPLSSGGFQATVHAGISTIYCNMTDEAAAILKTAHEGDRFIVTGRILNVLTKLVIFLEDCSFTEHNEEAEQAGAQQPAARL